MSETPRSILITGCSSGIGLASAHAMRARGWRVFATCRAEADAERLRGEGFESWVLDYADEASVSAGAARALEATEGRLGALFNNGAWALPGPVEDVPREALTAIFEANFFGPHQLTCAVLPAMRRAGAGRIVNCSSVLGFAAIPYRGPYSATKFAMKGLTDTLRRELRDTPIHISLIEPGPIATEIRVNARRGYERWILPRRDGSLHPAKRWRQIEARLYDENTAPDRFELPPERVVRDLIHACEAPNPAPRYFQTTPTWMANVITRFLPTRLQDRLLSG